MAVTSMEVIYSYVKEYIQAKEGGKAPPSQLKKMRDSLIRELSNTYSGYIKTCAARLYRASASLGLGLEMDDLTQGGLVGVIKGLDIHRESSWQSLDLLLRKAICSEMNKTVGNADPCLIGYAELDESHMAGIVPDGHYYLDSRSVIKDALGCLSEKERKAVSAYYYADMSTHGTAEIMGVSHTSIVRLIKSALAKLGDYLRLTHGEEAMVDLIRGIAEERDA